uniref:Uncharacterized protein n=1 Tax=Rhinopithecus roxellana TaxID=61622 RepID=A0A2K6RRH7_RHIRO
MPVCRSRGEGGSRKMLEPGMCPAETSLTPFVTRSLILLCFSVTHRGRGQRHSSPLLPAAACCISLSQSGAGQGNNPLPSLGLSPGLLRETFVSEGPFSPCRSAGAVLNALLMARGP